LGTSAIFMLMNALLRGKKAGLGSYLAAGAAGAATGAGLAASPYGTKANAWLDDKSNWLTQWLNERQAPISKA